MQALRNAQRMLEAQAKGIESKAEALAKFDDVATFLELARLHIEAERDIHQDQAIANAQKVGQHIESIIESNL